jgi:hypothetical protein
MSRELANYTLNPTAGVRLGADFVSMFARRGLT